MAIEVDPGPRQGPCIRAARSCGLGLASSKRCGKPLGSMIHSAAGTCGLVISRGDRRDIPD
jgi:hypothetical protein